MLLQIVTTNRKLLLTTNNSTHLVEVKDKLSLSKIHQSVCSLVSQSLHQGAKGRKFKVRCQFVTLHFCRVNGKIRGTSAPKQTSAGTMWIGSLGPRMFWGTRATNFSIYTTKMEGAGPKILGTGAKSKPCQKNCRVNRAFV